MPHNKANKALGDSIIMLYQNKYLGFNFTHFKEKLEEKTKVSYGFLYNLLSSIKIQSPRANKRTKNENQHPSRNRKKFFGELVQMDASLHRWFGTDKTQLHAALMMQLE